MSTWGAPPGSDDGRPGVPAIPPSVRPASIPVALPDAPHPAHDLPGEITARRHSRGTTVALVSLSVLLVLAIGTAAYLWLTTTRWQDTSAGWESNARALGDEVAVLQGDLDGATSELGAVRDQLTTAQDRITDLANEKAQLGDDNVASQQNLDYQQRISEAAGSVAAALTSCTDGQAELIGYLNASDAYDPADIERFSEDVDSLCQSATDANEALQKELEK